MDLFHVTTFCDFAQKVYENDAIFSIDNKYDKIISCGFIFILLTKYMYRINS